MKKEGTYYSKNKQQIDKYTKKYRQRNKKWYRDFKEASKCEECGESHPACLDFHHENPEEKTMAVAHMVGLGYSKKRILEEIYKCRILCANCHRKLQYN